MIKSLETSEEEFKNMKSNIYSKAGGILNIKDLNTLVVFPKYLFIYQHNPVFPQKRICVYSITRIRSYINKNTIMHCFRQF